MIPLPGPIDALYVQLGLDSTPYVKGWKAAGATTARETKAIGADVDKWGRQLGTKGQAAGKAYGKGLGTGLETTSGATKKALSGIAALTGGVTLLGTAFAGIKLAASFEFEMSRIKAVSSSTTAQLAPLRKEIIQLGKDTVFSAGEAAKGANELVKAGLSVSETSAALPGTLALAAAGEIAVAEAATIAANAMNMFGMAGKDTMRIADVMAAAVNASSLEMTDLAYSLKYVGPVAASLKIPFETVVAALAELGNQGIRGEQAGAALTAMLQGLGSPTDAAAAAMKKYQISIFDATGTLKPLGQILGDLQPKFAALNDQEKLNLLSDLFGKGMDANVGLKLIESGADGLDRMTDSITKGGDAATIAAGKQDNLMGSFEQLKGSIETLAISEGSPLMGDIRGLVDALTGLVNGFMNLDPAQQQVIERLALFGGGAVALSFGLRGLQSVLAQTSAMLLGTGAAGVTAAAGIATAEAATVTWVTTSGGGLLATLGAAAPAAGAAAGAGWASGFLSGVIPFAGQLYASIQAGKDHPEVTAAGWRAQRETWMDTMRPDAAAPVATAEQIAAKQKIMGLSLSLGDAFLKEAHASEAVTVATKLQAVAAEDAAKAEEAFKNHVAALTSGLSGLLSPTQAYTDATALATTAAEKHAKALGLSGDATTAYVAKSSASLKDFMTVLGKQFADQDALIWNQRKIVDRLVKSGVDPATIKTIMDQVGQLPAGMVAKFANASGPEFDKMGGLMGKAGERGALLWDEGITRDLDDRIAEQADKYVRLWDGSVVPKLEDSGTTGATAYVDKFGNYIGLELPKLAPVGTKAGVTIGQAIADGIASTSGYVKTTIDKYGNVLITGLNPILKMVGGNAFISRGNRPTLFADGGFLPQQATIQRPYGPNGLVQWAEPETGGEAFIPLAKNKRKRSIEIWRETGVKLDAFANGGFRSASDVPGAPGFAKDIAGTGAAAAKMMHDAVVGYVAQAIAQAVPSGMTLTGGTGIRGEIIRLAAKQLGKRYVWGATGPNSFDCSGLVQWVYNKVGVSVPRTAASQQDTGRAVSRANALPGDLTYYGDPAHHTAIYAGGGRTIEARGKAYGVVSAGAFRSGFSGVRSHFRDNSLSRQVMKYHAGGEVSAVLQVGERVLTQNQNNFLNTLGGELKGLIDVLRAQVNADKDVGKGGKGAAANELILSLFGNRSSTAGSYVSREQSRLGWAQAVDAPTVELERIITNTLGFITKATLEAQAQLDAAKARHMPAAEINALATELFGLKTTSADARKELQALARVPLENAASGWGNSLSMLNDQLDLLGNSSNASALLNARLPQQLGMMGGQYQSSMDLMNAPGRSQQDIMALGQQASGQVMSMFGASKGALDRQREDTMGSIDDSEKSWLAQWEKNGAALDAALTAESKSVSAHYAKERENNQQRVTDLSKSQAAAVTALTKGYNDRLLAMQDGEQAITREESRNAATKSLGNTENELRILQGQGFYTEADIARMRELETTAQDQRDQMAQQDAAWQRDDARTKLERERDAALGRLQVQQEAATEVLAAQVKAQDERLASQEEAAQARIESRRREHENERTTQAVFFQEQRDAAQVAYTAEVDALVTKYSAMLDTVQTQQQTLLSAAPNYQNSGYTLGLAFAQGLLSAQAAVANAAQTLGQTAAQYLELHSDAQLGPLSNLSHWMDAFVPTLIRPLKMSDLMQPIMDTYGPSSLNVNQQSAITVTVEFKGEGLANADIPGLARALGPIISQQIQANVRVAGLNYGS